LIRGCPNGETHAGKTGVRPDESIVGHERTQGSEPSQYLEEKKETSIPKVVASEIGTAQTCYTLGCGRGCRVGNSRVTNPVVSRSPLERGAIACDSHVGKNGPDSKPIPEYRGARETLWESAETIPQG
jgi:hypothetical protein